MRGLLCPVRRVGQGQAEPQPSTTTTNDGLAPARVVMMPTDVVTRLRSGQQSVAGADEQSGNDGGGCCHEATNAAFPFHSRPSSTAVSPRPSSMASSPASASAGPAPSGSRIGRPPQWTVSRSRKLARLYLYSMLPIETIIKVLEDKGFSPRKNSAQKTIHKMLENDPRYLRPESRAEMNTRISSLVNSPTRKRKRRTQPNPNRARGHHAGEANPPMSAVTSPSDQSADAEDAAHFDSAASLDAHKPRPRLTGHDKTTEPDDEYDAARVRDIKRRVSDCSTTYALQLSTLIREFTISTSSSNASSRCPSAAPSERSEGPGPPVHETDMEAYEPFPDPGFALPGDFLTAYTRSYAGCPPRQHGSGNCWCAIAEVTAADENSWLLPTGELSERARRVLAHPSTHWLMGDSFGNTPLHLFAALEGCQEPLLCMVTSSDTGSLGARNTAGQTFLHVLSLEWFEDLANPSAPLRRLLAHVRNTCPDLVNETDVYGRTFFHRAHSVIRDPPLLAGLISLFEPVPAPRRDAFGYNPVADTAAASPRPYIPPRRGGKPSPPLEDAARASASSGPELPASEGSFVAYYHARLVEVIHSSYSNPSVEDAQGRNGLHCLAEAILDEQAIRHHDVRSSTASPAGARPHLKRKLGSADARHTPAPASNSSSPSPSPSPAPRAAGTLAKRLTHLHWLLAPSASVAVNHYDGRGRTPLMAFVEEVADAQDDKAKTLQTILETLIRAGARTEARNRRGETALLLAARLGRKVALATLLEKGASVHARDADGRGLLEVLDEEVGGARAAGDVGLYARLEACRVLLTGRKEWGVEYAARTAGGETALVREWKVRERL